MARGRRSLYCSKSGISGPSADQSRMVDTRSRGECVFPLLLGTADFDVRTRRLVDLDLDDHDMGEKGVAPSMGS